MDLSRCACHRRVVTTMARGPDRPRAAGETAGEQVSQAIAPGKRTLSEVLEPAAPTPVQRVAEGRGEAPPGGARPSLAALFGPPAHGQPVAAPRPHRSDGVPSHLRDGIARLSGVDLGDVRVHLDSDRPREVQAAAFTQGSDIYVAPGQTRHLAHEAWHAVQQRQGRVTATGAVGGAALNDSPALEREADEMGALAVRGDPGPADMRGEPAHAAPTSSPIQRVILGLGAFRRRTDIPEPWVQAYLADLTHRSCHLYDEDIITYLDAVNAGWRDEAHVENTGVDHWDVVLTKAQGALVRINTAPDGNCAAHAIHAIVNRAGLNANQDGYRAPGPYIQLIRQAVQQRLSDGSHADEVRQRIVDRILDQDSVHGAGFGPQLEALLLPFEREAHEEQVGSSDGSSSRAQIGTVLDDGEGQVYVFNEAAKQSYSMGVVPDLQIGDRIKFQSDEHDKVTSWTKLGEGSSGHPTPTVATEVAAIAERLGIIQQSALGAINERPTRATQIHPVDIILSFCVEFEGLWRQLEQNRQSGQDMASIFQPEEWSACYATAKRLYQLLAVQESAEYDGSKIEAASYGADAIHSHAEDFSTRQLLLRAALEALTSDLRSTDRSGKERIYNCGYGIHGFALICRNGNIELLQSFANGLTYQLPASTIAESLKLNRSIPINEMLKLLQELGGDEEARAAAQRTLFSTTIETPEQPFPLCAFYWEGNALLPEAPRADAIARRLLKNIDIMKKAAGHVRSRIPRINAAKRLLE